MWDCRISYVGFETRLPVTVRNYLSLESVATVIGALMSQPVTLTDLLSAIPERVIRVQVRTAQVSISSQDTTSVLGKYELHYVG